MWKLKLERDKLIAELRKTKTPAELEQEDEIKEKIDLLEEKMFKRK